MTFGLKHPIHERDRGQCVALVVVAALAGEDEIAQPVETDPAPRQDMVDGARCRQMIPAVEAVWTELFFERCGNRRQVDSLAAEQVVCYVRELSSRNLFIRRTSSTHMTSNVGLSSPASRARPWATPGLSVIALPW